MTLSWTGSLREDITRLIKMRPTEHKIMDLLEEAGVVHDGIQIMPHSHVSVAKRHMKDYKVTKLNEYVTEYENTTALEHKFYLLTESQTYIYTI